METTMHYRGDLSVLTALARGEPVIEYTNGGGLSCLFSLGVTAGMHTANLNTKIAARYATSGGAINKAAGISNPEKLDIVLEVYKYLVSGGFIRMYWDFFGRANVIFDIDELFHVLEGRRTHLGFPGLDVKKILADPAPFRVGVTNRQTGRGRFLEVKRNVFERLRITASIQGACAPVQVEGRELGDGDVGKRIGPAFAKAAKHVLVVLNRPPIEERAWYERMFAPFLTRYVLCREPEGLREAAAKMDETFSRGLRRLEDCKKVKTLVLYPSWLEDIWPLTTNVHLMELAYKNARNNTEELIRKARAV